MQVDGASVNRFGQVEPFYGVLKQTEADPMDESGCKWINISAVLHASLMPFLNFREGF